MDKHKLRQVDFVFSLALITFGIVVLLAAARMPWTSSQKGVSSEWFLSPGLFPALLGIALIAFSLSVLATALRAGGHHQIGAFLRNAIAGVGRNRRLHRVLLMIVLIGTYVFGLVGHVSYYVASGLYLFFFMVLFHRPPAGTPRVRNIALLLVIAVVTPLVIGYLFSTYLNVPLP